MFILSSQNAFNPFPNKPWFLWIFSTILLKTLWEKEKLVVPSNFSFSHRVFIPLGELSAIFHQVKNCDLQTLSVWKSLRIVVWERFNLDKAKILSFGEGLTNFLRTRTFRPALFLTPWINFGPWIICCPLHYSGSFHNFLVPFGFFFFAHCSIFCPLQHSFRPLH